MPFKRFGIITMTIVLFVMVRPAMTTLAQEPPQQTATPGAPESSGTAAGGLNLDMKLDDLVKQDVLVPSLSTVVTSVNRQESTVGRRDLCDHAGNDQT